MRNITTFLIALLICASGYAQQALWGGETIISPEIHDDNSVTFRLNAPNAKKVEITGDFLPPLKIETPQRHK
jgi:1,4-alpha-glucan branching enzyme